MRENEKRRDKKMKYYHFIVIIDVAKQTYVYHYSSKNSKEVSEARGKLRQSLDGLPMICGLHMLTTDAASFESVQTMDPYFKGMVEINDLAEFREKFILYLEEFGLMGIKS